MEYRKANKADIAALTGMRMEFLKEHGKLCGDESETIEKQLPLYFEAHLGRDLIAYIARENGEAAAAVFLLIIEMPANQRVPSGRAGTILNVYTRPAFRRRGAAKEMMRMAVAYARARSLSYIDLKATEQGRALYESFGFVPDESRCVPMSLDLRDVSIEPVITDKKSYLELLLLADEQESMIERYLERGDMYALLEKNNARCVCVVTNEGEGVLELKNIACVPECRRRGYARAMIEFLFERYRGRYSRMTVGTGDCPTILSFYEKCGFKRDHIVKNFFTDNYDHPMYEEGVQLVDMVYLSRDF